MIAAAGTAIVALLAGVAATLAVWRALVMGDMIDAHFFLYVGREMAGGGIPYVDAFDSKGIVLYAFYAVAWLAAGVDGAALALALMVVAAIVAAALFPVSARSRILVAFAVAVYFGLWDSPSGGNAEHLAAVFQIAAICLLWRRRGADAFGALAAATFLVKPNLALPFVVMGLFLVYWRDWRYLSGAFFGGLATLAVGAAYLVGVGAWDAMLDATLRHNALYTVGSQRLLDGMGAVERMNFYLMMPPRAATALAVMFGACLFVFGRLSGMTPTHRSMAWLCGSLIAVAVIVAQMSMLKHDNYYVALMPALALTLALLAEIKGMRRYVAAGILLFGLVGAYSAVKELDDRYNHPEKFVEALPDDGDSERPLLGVSVLDARAEHAPVAACVRRHAPVAPLLLWGFNPGFYLATDSRAPSRYFFPAQMFLTGYLTDAQLRQEETRYLDARPPVILKANYRGADNWQLNWTDAFDARPVADVMPRLMDMVENDYLLAREGARGKRYYVRRDLPELMRCVHDD